MKRFLVVLLALGLIVAFSAPAAATDVKFSGSYYVVGYYDDNHNLNKTSPSDAFYAQRLRVSTVFQVAEGLSLNTRFDALERVWGVAATSTVSDENISWDRAWVKFAVPFGTFDVGYMEDCFTFGTAFGNDSSDRATIKFTNKTGPWTFFLATEKTTESDLASTTQADKDSDRYYAAATYKFNAGTAGVLYMYINDATTSGETSESATSQYKGKTHVLNPYFKATFGPVYLEGELAYATGNQKKYETAGTTDVDEESRAWYLYAKVNLGPLYVGGQYAFVSGDKTSTTDKREGGLFDGGVLYNPCLILWNYPFGAWIADLGGESDFDYQQTNASLYQVFAGMSPLEKLSLYASYSVAVRDEKGTYVDDEIGSEFDITATYKIYDNLSYMVGFGYFWTGDYFKGTSNATVIDDDYLIMNKLTLKF